MPRGRTSKKKHQSGDDETVALSAPVADMTGAGPAVSPADVAQAAAAQAQQLAEQSESNGGNFNVFDQPTSHDAKTFAALRGDRGHVNDHAEGLMQLATATQAMEGLEDGHRHLNERTGPDGVYIGADNSYLPPQEHMYPTVNDSGQEPIALQGQADIGKKRKRDTDKPSQRPSKAARNAATVYLDPNDQNAPADEFPSHGPFTLSEKTIVENFAEQFKAENGMDDPMLADLVQSKDRKMDEVTRNFWAQIYGIIPNRDNKAMQRHVRRRFHNYDQRGKWSAEDDEQLRQAFEEKPNQWTKIGEALNRMPEDCRDRWRNYVVCGESRKVDQWDPDEEARLSEVVNDLITKVKDDARAKAKEERVAFRENQDWLSLINFNLVSETLGHQRSRIQCLQHWKAMVQREEEGRAKRRMKRPPGSAPPAKTPRIGRNLETARQHWLQMRPGDKHAILREILESEARDEDQINWSLIIQRSTMKFWNAKDREYLWARTKKSTQFTPGASFREKVGEAMDKLENDKPDELDDHYRPDEDPRRAEAAELQREALEAIEKGQPTDEIVKRAKQQKREHRMADREITGSRPNGKKPRVPRGSRAKAVASESQAKDTGSPEPFDEETATDMHQAAPAEADMNEQTAVNGDDDSTEQQAASHIDPRLGGSKEGNINAGSSKKSGKKRGRPAKEKKASSTKKSGSRSKKSKGPDAVEEQANRAPTAQMTSTDGGETAMDTAERLYDSKPGRNTSADEDSE